VERSVGFAGALIHVLDSSSTPKRFAMALVRQ
jgi:hypothetical protein